MLPVIWTLFAVSAVGGFIVIAAYWLDVQDRPDLSVRARVAWSIGTLLFPLTIPAYAFLGGPAWPAPLRVLAFLPALALALFLGFVFGAFT
ncbi:MAG TPA: hypothetical protein VFM19_01515 [Candidatus Limnocylindria bacterium]|nr:hypothetical protein [Candidatus Limnocylindria bacterium]